MPFFDPVEESHKALLTPAVRKDEELPAIAAVAEAAVIAEFTRHFPAELIRADMPLIVSQQSGAYALDAANGMYICLRGFNPDPTLCIPGLADALKMEIAGVIRHLQAGWRINAHVSSEASGDGTKAITYRSDKNKSLPGSFGQFVRPWDIRPVGVAI